MKNFIEGFWAGMKRYGENITTLVNFILLVLVYFLGVGPPSIVAKLSGKKFLETGIKDGSYWSDLNLKKKPIDDYLRQF